MMDVEHVNEHVRSAELLEPLENYTQNGNCPARFRERKQKMIEKKTPTFSAVSSIVFDAVETVTNSLRYQVTKPLHGFFRANLWMSSILGSDFHSRITQRT